MKFLLSGWNSKVCRETTEDYVVCLIPFLLSFNAQLVAHKLQ